jgi:AcrR family transcriptional regulator
MSPSDTKAALLDATAALLVEGGLGEATTQKVGRRAGVAEGTIYRHFPSKDALLEAVFARAWARLDEAILLSLPPQEAPDLRLKAFLGTTLATMGSHPVEAALLRLEFAYLVANARGNCPIPAGSHRFIAILEAAIRLAQTEGTARPGIDPAVAAAFIYNGVSKTWATLPAGVDPTRLFTGVQTLLDAALFP